MIYRAMQIIHSVIALLALYIFIVGLTNSVILIDYIITLGALLTFAWNINSIGAAQTGLNTREIKNNRSVKESHD